MRPAPAQVLVVGKEGQSQSQTFKCRHGVTPAMRDARKRVFQKPHNVDPATMRQLEEDLLALASVCMLSSIFCYIQLD